MKINYENIDKLVRKLRTDLNLHIIFNDDTGRSIEFEAETQISECSAIVKKHRISFKKLELMPQIEVEQILSKKFKGLQAWSKK